MSARRPLRVAVAALFAALAVVVLGACTGSDAVGGNGNGYKFVVANQKGSVFPPDERKSPRSFTADLLDGGDYSLATDAGKVVVLNFWATWCAPCVVETPQLDNVWRQYKSKAVDFVGVNTKDTSDAARSFVKDNDITFPIVFDERAETALRLGNLPVQGLPFTVMIDKHGRVAAVYQGALKPKDLTPVLDKLLAES